MWSVLYPYPLRFLSSWSSSVALFLPPPALEPPPAPPVAAELLGPWIVWNCDEAVPEAKLTEDEVVVGLRLLVLALKSASSSRWLLEAKSSRRLYVKLLLETDPYCDACGWGCWTLCGWSKASAGIRDVEGDEGYTLRTTEALLPFITLLLETINGGDVDDSLPLQ